MTPQHDDDALFAFINGQNDALLMLKPKDPNDPYYMRGWKEAKHRLAQGEKKICEAFEQVQADLEKRENWEYTGDWEEF